MNLYTMDSKQAIKEMGKCNTVFTLSWLACKILISILIKIEAHDNVKN